MKKIFRAFLPYIALWAVLLIVFLCIFSLAPKEQKIGATPSNGGLPGVYNASGLVLPDGYGSALAVDNAGRIILSPSSTASFAEIIWTKATGTSTTSTDLYATTLRGVNAVFSGGIITNNTTSTGVSEQGAFVTQPDAGYVPFLNCLASSTAGIKVGCSIGVAGKPVLGVKAVADGIGYGAASSSSYGVEFFAPLVLYSGATTTVTTSTLISLTDYRSRVISGNQTTSTCPQQLFATTTADLPDGTTKMINGTSSTQMLVVSDSCTTDVNTTFGGVSKTGYFGPGDVSIFMWMKNMNKWRPVDPSPFIWK